MPQMSPMLWVGFPFIMVMLLMVVVVVINFEMEVDKCEDFRGVSEEKMKW